MEPANLTTHLDSKIVKYHEKKHKGINIRNVNRGCEELQLTADWATSR